MWTWQSRDIIGGTKTIVEFGLGMWDGLIICWIRNVQTCRGFLWVYLSQTDNSGRKQDLKCSGEWQLCGFFYTFRIKRKVMKITFRIKREVRKITWRWEKGRPKWGLVYRITNKIMCSLEEGLASHRSEKEAFQRCINLDTQK